MRDDTRPGFQAIQYDFAAYIRDPARAAVPGGVHPARMQVYRELFFNNMENFLATGFPVLKSVLEPSRWHDLVQGFFANHICHTPLFVGIAGEFLDYLAKERETSEDPPFLQELAHYEWVELALDVSEQVLPPPNAALLENPLHQSMSLSALAWPLVYRFPVHRIAPAYQPQEPAETPTCLLVYRDRDDKVRFLQVNPLTYRLLELLAQGGNHTLEVHLQQLVSEMGTTAPDTVIRFGLDLVRDWMARGIVV